MVKLNVKQLLDNSKKSKYWLKNYLETDYATLNKMLRNETKLISFKMLEGLCNAFDCEPNDLFVFTNETK